MLIKPAYLLLFAYGLLIPKISALLMIIFGIYKFLSNARKIFNYYIVEVLLLLFFLLSYYWVGITYDFYTVGNLFFFSFLAVSAYTFGATIDLKIANILHIFLYFFTGLMIVVFISTYQTYFTGNIDQALQDRVVFNMWSGKEQDSPVYGAYALLPMSLFFALFLKNVKVYEKIIIGILIIVSIIVVTAYQSRGPLLSMAIILLVAYIYLMKYQGVTLIKIRYLIPIILIFSSIYLSFETEIQESRVVESYANRIEKKGLKSARYDLWMQGIRALYVQPFGGKELALKSGHFKTKLVHNMWLDINYTSGITPLIFILIFMFKHVRYIGFLFSKSNRNENNVYFVALGLGILLPTFFEPMLDASFIWISLIAFYLALLKNFYYYKKGII